MQADVLLRVALGLRSGEQLLAGVVDQAGRVGFGGDALVVDEGIDCLFATELLRQVGAELFGGAELLAR